jgi:hypothetical protein
MGTFRKGLTTSPFQIPLLVYLCIQGFLIALAVPAYAEALEVPSWSIWNLAILLIAGGALSTFSRFNGNERLEEFSLWLVVLAAIIAVGIETASQDYAALGDDVAILLGCVLRIRVLRKGRKAMKTAIEIATNHDNHDGETTP